MSIPAIGYLRRDVSGVRQQWDENQIRSAARRLGYNLRKIIALTSSVHDVGLRLGNIAGAVGAEAVFVPNVAHFEFGVVPTTLVEVADVITVDPDRTYARWGDGQLPIEISGQRHLTTQPRRTPH